MVTSPIATGDIKVLTNVRTHLERCEATAAKFCVRATDFSFYFGYFELDDGEVPWWD